jgi:UDP-GlcNAc:undecaprenyl-phosphate/decaprenyl-phosphate GlcNAc-1-phosphate transferase
MRGAMSYWIMVCSGLVGMVIVFLGVPLVLKAARLTKLPSRALDLHHGHGPPIPRLGGLVLVAAYLGIELFRAIYHRGNSGGMAGSWIVEASSLAMFGLGFWDDLKPLGAKRKLVGQVAIAGCVCALGVGIERFRIPFTGTIIALNGWGVLITVSWLVGMTNLINLIDGVDGLAGGICLMLMALLAYVGHQSGSFELLASGMAGALLAFLWFNFPPARIYLGDGGAYFLGFQIGLLAVLSSHKGTVFAALVAPLFVLALPILDMTLAILRRGLRGLPIFRPDRKHIHHHLLAMGLSRRRAVLTLYAVTLIFLAMGFAAFASRGQLIPLLLGIAIIIVLLCAGKLTFSREWFAVGKVVGNSLGMRREVQYTLALTRWLVLEGDRCISVEELWANLVFAAQRLGFNYISLTLADEQRSWEQTKKCGLSHSVRHELQGGRFGILELKAPACESLDTDLAPEAFWPSACERSFCPCVSEPKVFGIVGDLLAEGWAKAAIRWNAGEQTPLRFDGRLTRQRNHAQAGVPRPVAPAQDPSANRELVNPPLEDAAR